MSEGVLARLRDAGLRPRKGLGQNYLHDPTLLAVIAEAAQIGPHDPVLEVGTGPATLTRELARRAGSVLTVELDPRMAAFARRELEGMENVEILVADALEKKSRLQPALEEKLRPLSGLRWVSNLPYAIATPLILAFLEAGLDWSRAVLTLQLEVARKLSAAPGERSYGAPTALAAFFARARVVRRIGAGSFWPRPRVDSALLLLEPRRPGPPRALWPDYRAWVRRLFRAPRRQLRTLAREALGPDGAVEVLSRSGWDPERRPSSLGPEELLWLAENFPVFSR